MTTASEAKFTKTQLVQSKKYRQYRDVLTVILSDDASYTHKEVKQALDKFLKTPVRNKINKKGE